MQTIYLIKPTTTDCQKWILENVDITKTVGGGIVAESRYAFDIVEGMIQNGLRYGEDFEIVA